MAGISEVAAVIMGGNSYDAIKPDCINLKVAVDKKFKIPKEFMTELVSEVDKDKPKDSARTYSIEDKSITETDIKQYKIWAVDKSVTPNLLKEFKTDDDYSKFMTEYIDTHLTLDNDPADMKTNKTFSIANDEQYGFSLETDAWQGDEQGLDFDHVIGSVLFSITFAHLFHLCTTDYPAHMALDDYYNEMPEKIDALAEKFLSDNSSIMITNAILPGLDPIDYFERLKKFVATFSSKMEGVYVDTSAYQSEMDDIINLISSTLYKLKRLATPKVNKSFSIEEN